jgi:3-oxoacyl-[acyl-carrier protein] reductase
MGEGRRALVTGGASGFGLAIARRAVEDGGRVSLVDVSEPALEAAVRGTSRAAIPAMSGTARPWHMPWRPRRPAWAGWTRWW